MSTVIIGSARHNELYDIPGKDDWRGGQPGDQLQTSVPDFSGECSMQEWYLHPLGWIVLRAKNAGVREKIAKNMESICNNPNYGYDQPHDQDGIRAAKPYGYDASRVTTPTQIDCARGVRLCILYAGVNVPDFYTATEVNAVMSTGEFEKLTGPEYCESPDRLKRGDILVTRSKGHTVVVLSDGQYANEDENKDADTYEITGNTVNMRSGPSTDWPVLQVLKKGEQVKGSSVNDGWLQGEAKGIWGYVSLKYLQAVSGPSFAITTGKVHIRTGAGIQNKSICTVPKGTEIILTGEKRKVLLTTWYKTKYNGKTGWISGKYLRG